MISFLLHLDKHSELNRNKFRNKYLLNGILKKWKLYKCRLYDLKVIYTRIKLDFYFIISTSRTKTSKNQSVFTLVLACGIVDDS